jgi:hypothetical protein
MNNEVFSDEKKYLMTSENNMLCHVTQLPLPKEEQEEIESILEVA